MLQECLNRSEAHLWGVLTNGRQLRLLRDSSALATAAYVEFDLEAIFDGELFSEFVLLYRLLHASRFEVARRRGAVDLLAGEVAHRGASSPACGRCDAAPRRRAGGNRARSAPASCGHPANAALRGAPRTLGRLPPRPAAAGLPAAVPLRRRGPGRAARPGRRRSRPGSATPTYFSTARLRRAGPPPPRHRAQRPLPALRIVLDALGDENGRPELGLPGLGGLFDHTDADDAAGTACALSNEAPARQPSGTSPGSATRLGPLATSTTATWAPRNWASVYESLLELRPEHERRDARSSWSTAAGNDRKTTGSYYTPVVADRCCSTRRSTR